ncbi:hypothetical protein V6N13_030990 [Hibiscus sabdariffa]|uniref:AP2/ERF domain-containing protein n=1 Tax=Hibiscus sabdariffa TaxID=183260 RepID=A0ABR2CND7_9ROSI
MNSNNWLPFPTSPTISSLPTHLQYSQSHRFNLGLFSDCLDNPFHVQEWNLINTGETNQVPKVEDFLGVSKPQSPTLEFQENANNLHSLNLSMGGGGKGTTGENDSNMVETPPARTSVDTFGQRTSIYRGVTRHRWTGRYEAHLWDNSCRREGQSRKGRQGGYDKEEKAARAYDLAALKYWGTSTTTNFPISNYDKELEDMKNMTRQEFVAAIRRKSSGFSRGASMYRGVTRHHQQGRWQARIGRVAGNKDLYLGTFSTEEEAAEAYDIAAIKFRGLNAVTNFEMSRYDVKTIVESNALPIGGGGAAKRLKEAQALESSRKREEIIALNSSTGFQYGNPSAARFQGYPLMEDYGINSQYTQDYMQTQLQLHQQPWSYDLHQSSHDYIQNNPGSAHGLMMNMGSAFNTTEELGLVKVDYDMPSDGYGGWSGDSVQCSNPGVFSMWMT